MHLWHMPLKELTSSCINIFYFFASEKQSSPPKPHDIYSHWNPDASLALMRYFIGKTALSSVNILLRCNFEIGQNQLKPPYLLGLL